MNGDVRLQVESLMPERLIMRCLREGAIFRSIRRTGTRQLTIETDPESARILLELCRKYSVPCREINRCGKDAMLRRLKRRSTLLAGMLVCIACMSFFLSRIWLIDIESTGEHAADLSALEQTLSALNIRPGIPVGALNPSLLEAELVAAAPDYSFIGVRRQGVRLLVEASPSVPKPELYELSGEGDLVAACGGVILSVNVRSGEACVQPGDTVIQGQVLIRGTEKITKEEKRRISALGEVVARTWHEGTAVAGTTVQKTVRTGKSDVSVRLRLLNYTIDLVSGSTYSSQETATEILPIGGLFLPLEIHRTTAYETQARSVRLDEAALRSALARLAFASAGLELNRSQPDDAAIADRWIEYTTDAAGRMIARAVYEMHADIAVPRDALAQQGG